MTTVARKSDGVVFWKGTIRIPNLLKERAEDLGVVNLSRFVTEALAEKVELLEGHDHET